MAEPEQVPKQSLKYWKNQCIKDACDDNCLGAEYGAAWKKLIEKEFDRYKGVSKRLQEKDYNEILNPSDVEGLLNNMYRFIRSLTDLKNAVEVVREEIGINAELSEIGDWFEAWNKATKGDFADLLIKCGFVEPENGEELLNSVNIQAVKIWRRMLGVMMGFDRVKIETETMLTIARLGKDLIEFEKLEKPSYRLKFAILKLIDLLTAHQINSLHKRVAEYESQKAEVSTIPYKFNALRASRSRKG